MDKNTLKSRAYGSKEIASAAIKIALTSQREERKKGIRQIFFKTGGHQNRCRRLWW